MNVITPTLDQTQTKIHDRAFLEAVLSGLKAPRKNISCTWLYDHRGAELFEEITQLPEYYPTRTELAIMERIYPQLAKDLPEQLAVVEFGSGSGRKSRLLLEQLRSPAAYIPIDISGEYLFASAQELSADFPALNVEPVLADFTQPLDLPMDVKGLPRLGFFPGSTIGNFDPDAALHFLQTAKADLGTDSYFLIGVDLRKDTNRLIAAYDDAQGVTAEFNLNLLRRINRELDGTFDLQHFRHEARYDEDLGRIEMHLVSCRQQTVRISDQEFTFRAEESIHTENSYKYSISGFQTLAKSAGWQSEEVWTDDEELFSLHLLRC